MEPVDIVYSADLQQLVETLLVVGLAQVPEPVCRVAVLLILMRFLVLIQLAVVQVINLHFKTGKMAHLVAVAWQVIRQVRAAMVGMDMLAAVVLAVPEALRVVAMVAREFMQVEQVRQVDRGNLLAAAVDF
jgi:hypothetical protein